MTVRGLKIRPMRAADVGTVCQMIKELTVLFGDVSQITDRDLRRHALGRKRTGHVLLAFVAGKPVGFCLSSDWFNFTRGFMVRNIHLLFVRKQFQYSGIGTALVKLTAHKARKSGCKRLDIQAAKQNKIARKAYKSLGFSVRPDHPVHYRLLLKK